MSRVAPNPLDRATSANHHFPPLITSAELCVEGRCTTVPSMTQVPRCRQKKISIRSDKAAELLKGMARDGRTKVSIIEDALRRAVAEAKISAEG